MNELLAQADRAGQEERSWTCAFRSRPPLRAGETVYCGWCALGVAGGRRVGGARGLHRRHDRQQHGLWDTAATLAGIAAVQPCRRRAGRAGSAGRFRAGRAARSTPAPRHHRADDQFRRRRARLRRGREISSARRAQLGTKPRDGLQGRTSTPILARSQRRHADTRDDRDQGRARQCRGHRRNRRASTRCSSAPTTSHCAQRRCGAGHRSARGRAGHRPRSAPRRRRPARFRASIAATPRARSPWPSAASAFSPSAAISAFCGWHRRAAEGAEGLSYFRASPESQLPLAWQPAFCDEPARRRPSHRARRVDRRYACGHGHAARARSTITSRHVRSPRRAALTSTHRVAALGEPRALFGAACAPPRSSAAGTSRSRI